LQLAISEKSDEIVYILDLFDGKMTINEILNLEIPLLANLKEAKIRINNELKKTK